MAAMIFNMCTHSESKVLCIQEGMYLYIYIALCLQSDHAACEDDRRSIHSQLARLQDTTVPDRVGRYEG